MEGLFADHPHADVGYCQCKAHYQDDSRIFGGPLNEVDLLAGNNQIANVATVIKRAVFHEIGWYDPRIALIRCNDWDFLQRCVVGGVQFAFLPKVLTHEYGVRLSDSLGNTYDVSKSVIKAIASCDRRSELRPERIVGVDPISLPSGASLTSQQLSDYLRLLIEFAALGNRKSLFYKIAGSSVFARLNIPLNTRSEQIQWWARTATAKWRKDFDDMLIAIDEKQAYIDQQQAYIDQQQAYIDQQQAYISKLKLGF